MKAALLPLLLAASVSGFAISKRFDSYSGDTQNDVGPGKPCAEVTILFARGTFETGNTGEFAGPPFFETLFVKLPLNALAIQGTDYPANVLGFFEGGDPIGIRNMTAQFAQVEQLCPKTKLVLSGYSQGAQIVHKVAKGLTAAQTAKVAGVVLFGDPYNGTAVGSVPASKTKVFCDYNDDICKGGENFFGAHLTYNQNATQAADWVIKNVLHQKVVN